MGVSVLLPCGRCQPHHGRSLQFDFGRHSRKPGQYAEGIAHRHDRIRIAGRVRARVHRHLGCWLDVPNPGQGRRLDGGILRFVSAVRVAEIDGPVARAVRQGLRIAVDTREIDGDHKDEQQQRSHHRQFHGGDSSSRFLAMGGQRMRASHHESAIEEPECGRQRDWRMGGYRNLAHNWRSATVGFAMKVKSQKEPDMAGDARCNSHPVPVSIRFACATPRSEGPTNNSVLCITCLGDDAFPHQHGSDGLHRNPWQRESRCGPRPAERAVGNFRGRVRPLVSRPNSNPPVFGPPTRSEGPLGTLMFCTR